MYSIWTNGSWQVVTTSNDFLFHYFILFISLSLVLSYSSNGTQFISLSSIIDKVQRKGGPLIKNRFQTTMLVDGGPPSETLHCPLDGWCFFVPPFLRGDLPILFQLKVWFQNRDEVWLKCSRWSLSATSSVYGHATSPLSILLSSRSLLVLVHTTPSRVD